MRELEEWVKDKFESKHDDVGEIFRDSDADFNMHVTWEEYLWRRYGIRKNGEPRSKIFILFLKQILSHVLKSFPTVPLSLRLPLYYGFFPNTSAAYLEAYQWSISDIEINYFEKSKNYILDIKRSSFQ